MTNPNEIIFATDSRKNAPVKRISKFSKNL